ncbi:MAG: MoxR family ATPase [Gemmatimonadota bacterium]
MSPTSSVPKRGEPPEDTRARQHERVSHPGRIENVVQEVSRFYRGDPLGVKLSLAAILARGHILVEDVPGVGKTTLARSLAGVLDLRFRRIQFTADLLPSDLLGVPVHDPTSGRFRFRAGPIFTQVLLADEINRAPPRTQSGLLQAMQEGEVTVDRATRPLPRPFVVLATQNPLEHHGTYPLPESQLDRFLLRLAPGYPDAAAERQILQDHAGSPRATVPDPCLSPEDVLGLQDAVDAVRSDPGLLDYILTVVRRSREHPGLRSGVSPRGAVAFFQAARALAVVEGRNHLIPDDVTRVLHPCLDHRVVLRSRGRDPEASRLEAEAILREVVEGVALPV